MVFVDSFQKLVVRFVTKSTKIRHLSTAVQPAQVQEETLQPFRTKENNPVHHNVQHINRFYTVPEDDVKVVYSHGLPLDYEKDIKTFAEMAILIRKPAIELLTCLSQTDYTKPVNKYVIYGEYGCGKTTTLSHIMHYGYKTNKILVNINWAQKWFRFPKEVANSETKDGMLDLPIDAATWLKNFKTQNASVLAQADLKLSKTYEWNSQDSSMENSPLTGIIDFGINRAKYACDVITVLLDELKRASIADKCKILVVIDGFNAFFSQHTRVKNEMRELVTPSKISLTKPFLDITKPDWCNGQIVVTVDERATKERRESHLPRYLLSKEGFDHLDPFLPVAVENYTQDEFDAVVEYYKCKKWIRHITVEGQNELKLVTGSNPFKLMEYCKHL